jgi:hypothetical protein
MIKTNHFKTGLLATLIASSVFLSGCDQIRSRVAELISPETPAQALEAAEKLIEAGKYQEARNKAQPAADKPESPMRGDFAFTTARASAFTGDTEAALRYLALALQSKSFNSDEVMSEPAFEPLQTNIQFLRIITQSVVDPRSRETTATAPALEVGTGNTLIRQDSKGTEVRAGDVVIKLPN